MPIFIGIKPLNESAYPLVHRRAAQTTVASCVHTLLLVHLDAARRVPYHHNLTASFDISA